MQTPVDALMDDITNTAAEINRGAPVDENGNAKWQEPCPLWWEQFEDTLRDVFTRHPAIRVELAKETK